MNQNGCQDLTLNNETLISKVEEKEADEMEVAAQENAPRETQEKAEKDGCCLNN